jgi:ABC-type phosphonate transport system ATPase subunit
MVEEVMGFDADLIRYDHELTRQHADDEFREGIEEAADRIKELLPELSERNLRAIRDAAQDIIDDVNRRLP